MTRFKVDWGDDGEGVSNENQPPQPSCSENTESNQMAIDSNSTPAGGDMPLKQLPGQTQQSDSNSVGAVLNDKSKNGLPAETEAMQM